MDGGKLAEAAVDEDEVGAAPVAEMFEAASDDFAHGGEVVVFVFSDFELLVVGAGGDAVSENDVGSYDVLAGLMRDVEAFDAAGGFGEAEEFLELSQCEVGLEVDVVLVAENDFGLEFAKVGELVSEFGGLFEIVVSGGLSHVGGDLFGELFAVAFDELDEAAEVALVVGGSGAVDFEAGG